MNNYAHQLSSFDVLEADNEQKETSRNRPMADLPVD